MILKSAAEDGSALTWRKSSYSSNDGPDCVEVAATVAAVHVRDSKNAEGPRFAVAGPAWARFVAYASQG
ncbi:DUF397 domain-containing protein [Streptomyces halstedii]|uniref:DUF397 domain-containing protein n=1 Tax=Streptomyces halstedii TaxID=1944 RepID=A0A6N9TZB2_STRHA|nr:MULTISPECIES: DUF397 domain-containing protein [Streptomyces]KDQ68934.1 hypothetical protein DT87_17585 [Streptomyces sp. NTK 937]MBV7670411.1 DUF397 domain-containing protein [Streptomyces halstedii]MYQ49783.1 DUF397 domain-containing protein [Streptomyces sp. SID4941]NEA14946.1 DUF397 domain-containing protein [Streptomyces halstedii]WSX36586.1 DUF397 domain-containing protein [Streptomyces halstedii]